MDNTNYIGRWGKITNNGVSAGGGMYCYNIFYLFLLKNKLNLWNLFGCCCLPFNTIDWIYSFPFTNPPIVFIPLIEQQ